MKFTGKFNSALLKIKDTLHKHLSFYGYKKIPEEMLCPLWIPKASKSLPGSKVCFLYISDKIAISVIGDSIQIQLEKFQVKRL